jgi:hypothetical protein
MDRVECYAGASQPETPRRVIWQGEAYQVVDIINRQRQPNRLVFLVRCSPGVALFELTYFFESETWQIHTKGSLPV